MASRERVAVLGAGGTMRFPMARNLARAGFGVRAWNRSRERRNPSPPTGAGTDSPAEAADGASVILTMLADADAVTSAVDGDRGAFSALPPATGSGTVDGAIWLQMSTIGEEAAQRCADLAGRQDIPFVDALGQKTIWVGEAMLKREFTPAFRRPAAPAARAARRQRRRHRPGGSVRPGDHGDPVDGEDDALAIANDTEYGLSSAVFAGDTGRGVRFAQRAGASMTHVNDSPVNEDANTAFGGVKASWIGRFGGEWAIGEFTVPHWISVQRERRHYPI